MENNGGIIMKKTKILFFMIIVMPLTACSNFEEKNDSSLSRNYSKVVTVPTTIFAYDSLNDMEKDADFIISGKAVNEVAENNSYIPEEEVSIGKKTEEEVVEYVNDQLSTPTFVSNVKVLETYKGNIKESQISVVFNYAVEDGTLVQYEGAASPVYEGLEYTYFLKKYDTETLNIINTGLKTNYKELYYVVSSGTGVVNTDNKDKENIEAVEVYLPETDIVEIVEELSE